MEKFIEACKVLSLKKAVTTVGNVTEINGTTCTVERENNLPPLTDVRLTATIGDFENTIIVYPKIGSEVLCLEIENNKAETSIISYTEIDKVTIKINKATFIIENGKFTIKNDKADLKEILKSGFEQLDKSIITTPSGPGNFSPNDKLKFQELKQNILKLFS